MATAGQIALAGADLGQQGRGTLGVHGFAVVAGAKQGHVFVAQVQRVAGLGDQRHGLERLERGAGEHGRSDVACAGEQLALGVDHGEGAVVGVFKVAAPEGGGDGGVLVKGGRGHGGDFNTAPNCCVLLSNEGGRVIKFWLYAHLESRA